MSQTLFKLFTKNLTLLVPVTRSAGHNADLPSNNNVSKMMIVNTAFTCAFSKEDLISFPMISKFKYFALVFHELVMFKICGNNGISKIEFLNLAATERVKQNQKNLKTIPNLPSL